MKKIIYYSLSFNGTYVGGNAEGNFTILVNSV